MRLLNQENHCGKHLEPWVCKTCVHFPPLLCGHSCLAEPLGMSSARSHSDGQLSSSQKMGQADWHPTEFRECDAAISPEEAKATQTGQMCHPALVLPHHPRRKDTEEGALTLPQAWATKIFRGNDFRFTEELQRWYGEFPYTFHQLPPTPTPCISIVSLSKLRHISKTLTKQQTHSEVPCFPLMSFFGSRSPSGDPHPFSHCVPTISVCPWFPWFSWPWHF